VPRWRKKNGIFSPEPPTYKEAHWGLDPEEIRHEQVGEPRDNTELRGLGELVQVVYLTQKGGDPELVEYEHDFRGKLPLLAYGAEDGRLYIVGGSYKVKRHGIVG
jgi:hypothetical protein